MREAEAAGLEDAGSEGLGELGLALLALLWCEDWRSREAGRGGLWRGFPPEFSRSSVWMCGIREVRGMSRSVWVAVGLERVGVTSEEEGPGVSGVVLVKRRVWLASCLRVARKECSALVEGSGG